MGKGKHVASRIRTGRAAGHGNTAMRGHRCGSRRRYTRPSRALVGFAGEEHLKWRGSHKAYADTRGSGIALPNFVSKSVFGTRRLNVQGYRQPRNSPLRINLAPKSQSNLIRIN